MNKDARNLQNHKIGISKICKTRISKNGFKPLEFSGCILYNKKRF